MPNYRINVSPDFPDPPGGHVARAKKIITGYSVRINPTSASNIIDITCSKCEFEKIQEALGSDSIGFFAQEIPQSSRPRSNTY
ncbi:hypothetical protein ACGE0T_10745 [Parabacteroides sp. APC149_11_2_Y6]